MPKINFLYHRSINTPKCTESNFKKPSKSMSVSQNFLKKVICENLLRNSKVWGLIIKNEIRAKSETRLF